MAADGDARAFRGEPLGAGAADAGAASGDDCSLVVEFHARVESLRDRPISLKKRMYEPVVILYRIRGELRFLRLLFGGLFLNQGQE